MPALRIKFNTISNRVFEIIDFQRNEDGSNYAVIHMPDDTITPYVTVWNLTTAGPLVAWDMGHYCSTRQQAEKKFYELTGVIKG